MNRYLLCFLFLLGYPSLAQQVIKGRSKPQSFNISKTPPKPPLLNLVNGQIKLVDANGNRAIDANENCTLEFELENRGYGDGIGLNVIVTTKGAVAGLQFDQRNSLPVLGVGKKQKVIIPIKAGMDLPEGKVIFEVFIEEPRGFNMDKAVIQLDTKAFKQPKVELISYSITSENIGYLMRKKPILLKACIKNNGAGTAEQVEVNLVLPANVMILSGEQKCVLNMLASADTVNFSYDLIVNDNYVLDSIPFRFNISERFGKFAYGRTIIALINQPLLPKTIVIESNDPIVGPKVGPLQLISDVDREIPINKKVYPNRYALIIGNEDYATYQTNLKKESNVDYAVADALSFAVYANKILGIDTLHITTLKNTQDYRLKAELNRMSDIVKARNGDAEIFFYYSGHGVPDNSGETYLLPVNVTMNMASEAGISLSELYKKLVENKPKRATVILDACFSGAGRNQGLFAAKGAVRIKPTDILEGNLVVFSSSSGDQKSQFDSNLKHGVFTYFLLKKLKETKGNVSYGVLVTYLEREVPLFLLENHKETQSPQVKYNHQIEQLWANWTFVDHKR